MVEYVGYLRRHKEVRRPEKAKEEETSVQKAISIEQMEDGIAYLWEGSNGRDSIVERGSGDCNASNPSRR